MENRNLPAPGMSLRDYFAASALNGLLSGTGEYTVKGFADLSYELADAMLKAGGYDNES